MSAPGAGPEFEDPDVTVMRDNPCATYFGPRPEAGGHVARRGSVRDHVPEAAAGQGRQAIAHWQRSDSPEPRRRVREPTGVHQRLVVQQLHEACPLWLSTQ